MPDEPLSLLQAALELLEQQRRAGEVNLREVAEAVVREVESSKAGQRVSRDEERRLRCELIKAELSRRWEEAGAAPAAQGMAPHLPPEALASSNESAADSRSRFFARMSDSDSGSSIP